LSDYIVSIQTKNEEQTKEIESLTKEKETLLNHAETQFRNLQKKNEVLEKLLGTHVQLLENKHKPTTITTRPLTAPTTTNFQTTNLQTTNLQTTNHPIASADEDLVRLKSEISRAKRALEDEKMCVVCQDAEKVIAFVPCGHKCACERCSVGLRACPLCRIPCEVKCRIYQ